MRYRGPDTKKKKASLFKFFLILFIIVVFSLGIYSCFKKISNSNFFTIKKVKIKGDIGWLEQSVKFLLGENLFFVDLSRAKKILIHQNPEIETINFNKLWPDTVYIRFTLKQPIAILEPGQLAVDRNGFLLELEKFKNGKVDGLPMISGIPIKQFALRGRLISEQWLNAFEIINLFSKEQALNDYKLTKVEVGQVSENSLFIKKRNASAEVPAIIIKIGEGKILDKLKMLEIFFKKANVDWPRVNYIDLRFKEPIVGLKNE
ncbi:MAG: hypothetical protein AB1629_07375 [Candidatus Omnitrophota bacterium]